MTLLSNKLIALFCLLPGLWSCTKSIQQLSEQTVVKVNTNVLTAGEFSKRLFLKIKDYDALTVKEPLIINKSKDDVIDEFILESLAMTWSQNSGLQLKDSQVQEELQRVLKSYPDDLSFKRVLATEGVSYEFWLRSLRTSLIQKLVFNKVTENTEAPTKEEIKDFYNKNKEQFKTRDRIKIRQIVVTSESQANRLLKELSSGQKIANLAARYSVGPEAKEEGLVGWVEKGYSDTFDKAFNFGVGRYGSIIKSNLGFHIIEILDMKRGGVPSQNEVENKIVVALMETKKQKIYEAWLDAELRAVKVYKNEALLQALVVETKGS
jgi:peptidyl-prolyl cis-trans isomerase C